MKLREIFGKEKPVISVLKLPPLPGSPHYHGTNVDSLVERAVKDAENLKEVDGIELVNWGDAPYLRGGEIGHETVSAMAVIAREVRKETGLPIGINLLINGTMEAAAVALASDAKWIRSQAWAYGIISSSGYVEAAAPRTLRYLKTLRLRLEVFAELPGAGSRAIISDKGLEELAVDAEFFGCSALVVHGLEELKRVKRVTRVPVLVDAAEALGEARELADGVYLRQPLKSDG